MWCIARALVDSNFSKQVSQMWFWVSDWVADMALVCLGEGAEAMEAMLSSSVVFSVTKEPYEKESDIY